jgi:hypothetical protein
MPPDDTYVPTLPRAVREQVARANQLARDAGIANVPDDNNPLPVVSSSPPVEPPADTPAAAEGAPAPTQPEHSPAPPEAPGQPPSAQPQPPPQPPPTIDWEQRFNTLQGKYNTELPELRGQIRSLQEILARGQDHHIPPPPSNGQRPTSAPVPIPQSDIDNWGPELITAAQRWAEAKFAPVLADYERRLHQVEGNTQQIAQVSLARGVEGALDQQVPNWQQININPLFIDWLAQLDPFSGRSRKELITEAYGSGNAARTIAFFQAFQREQTAVSPTTPGILPNQTGNGAMPVGPAATVPLANLAVPGRGQAAMPSPAPGASSKRNWTGAQITALYEQKRRGAWIGREAEFDALERDIIAAPLEGRIRE